MPADPGHGSVGHSLWAAQCELDCPSEEGGFGRLFSPYAQECFFRPWIETVFGHHGRPVSGTSSALANLMSPHAADAARAFVEACAILFPLASEHASTLDRRARATAFNETSWLIAGIAMLADWIGSNQLWFPYVKPDDDLVTYWRKAQWKAEKAMRFSGLSPPVVSPGFSLRDALAVAEKVPDGPVPSDLQTWALTEFAPAGQSLVIIEDLTGSGKTEAALIASHRLMAAGLAGGLYWALPTMATANALYKRLAASYRRLFPTTRSRSRSPTASAT